jgi:hypothetical protein
VVLALPERLGLDQINIPTRILRHIVSSMNLTDVAIQVVPEDWLSSKLIQIFRPLGTDDQAEDRQFIQTALRGAQGVQIARAVVGAAQACTADEVRRLRDFLNPQTRRATVINFICNPQTREDLDLNTVMQEIVATALASAADQIVASIPNPFATLSIPTPSLETPLGTLSLRNGSLHLTLGSLDIEYSLRTASPYLQTSANVVLMVSHSLQRATEEPGDEPAPANPDNTETGSSNGLVSRITASLQASLTALNNDLTALAASVSRTIWLVLGGFLVLILIQVLFYVRTLRAIGLWLGSVLTASGLAILLLYPILTATALMSVPDNGNLSPEVAELRAALVNAITSAFHNQLSNPLMVSSILTLLVGVFLLAVVFWRMRNQASRDT